MSNWSFVCGTATRITLHFEFMLYQSLFNLFKAKKAIVLLVDGIVKALQELHDNQLAHLDIRLENVCFNDDGV